MTSRRQFLGTGAVSVLAVTAARAAKTTPTFSPQEFEARIARRDFRDITKNVLPTPSMIVDLDLFDKNVKKLADHSKGASINLRPHVKVHKSVDISKRQIGLGSIGVTTATIAESELMSEAGIKGVLWTKQPASTNNIARAIALTKRDPTFLFVADDPMVLDWVQQAAAEAKVKCRIAVAVYAGMVRQGIANGKPALELAQRIAASKNLKFEGYMAYSGAASHTNGYEARKKKTAEDLVGVQETVELSKKAGLPIGIVSGGSTGTYDMDKQNGLTELECGSYIFMDTSYQGIGSKNGDTNYTDFQGALTVLATVDSRRHPNVATTDYGNKALAQRTDKVKDMPWLEVANQGAEYGALKWKDGEREVKLGDRVEIYITKLDMSTAVYDRYYVARGNQIVDVWPIMGRAGAAQR